MSSSQSLLLSSNRQRQVRRISQQTSIFLRCVRIYLVLFIQLLQRGRCCRTYLWWPGGGRRRGFWSVCGASALPGAVGIFALGHQHSAVAWREHEVIYLANHYSCIWLQLVLALFTHYRPDSQVVRPKTTRSKLSLGKKKQPQQTEKRATTSTMPPLPQFPGTATGEEASGSYTFEYIFSVKTGNNLALCNNMI